MQLTRRFRNRPRRGAATVEFALVAPLFILFLFGLIEFGRMMMVQQILVQTSRRGARHAIVNGSTVENTKDEIEQQLASSTITVIRDNIAVAPDPSTAAAGTAITVTITVTFDDVTWLPGASLFDGIQLRGSTTMRRETAQ